MTVQAYVSDKNYKCHCITQGECSRSSWLQNRRVQPPGCADSLPHSPPHGSPGGWEWASVSKHLCCRGGGPAPHLMGAGEITRLIMPKVVGILIEKKPWQIPGILSTTGVFKCIVTSHTNLWLCNKSLQKQQLVLACALNCNIFLFCFIFKNVA